MKGILKFAVFVYVVGYVTVCIIRHFTGAIT